MMTSKDEEHGFKDEVQGLLGTRMREAREAAGFSVRRLAYEIDRPELTIQRWERGENLPSMTNVVRYAKAVEADPWELWHGRKRTSEEIQKLREILRSPTEEEKEAEARLWTGLDAEEQAAREGAKEEGE
jgi:transcriptional regulator with XRE-family HTH domain